MNRHSLTLGGVSGTSTGTALPAGALGLVMNYAYCLNAPYDFASNPVEIHIVP